MRHLNAARRGPTFALLMLLALALSACATLNAFNPFVTDETWMSSKAIDELDEDEDATEHLARDLQDLSMFLKDGAWDKAAEGHAQSSTVAAFPRREAQPKEKLELVHTYAWSGGATNTALSRQQVAAEYQRFMGQFSEVEATRVRVRQSSFHGDHERAAARIVLKLVTKDLEGRREWLVWEADLRAQLEDDRWRISELKFVEPTSKIAVRPLFNEVSEAAQVALDMGPVEPDLDGQSAYQFYGGAVVDIDGNGFLDIYQTAFSENFFFLNDGHTFTDVSAELGLKDVDNPNPVGPLFFDYDNDGDQDLFVAIAGRREPWTPQRLYRNDSVVKDGKVQLKFTDISKEAGVDVEISGYSAIAGDINGDGWQDIYITSYWRWDIDRLPNRVYGADGPENMLLVSQGDGTFKEEAKARGVECPYFSFSGQFVDYDEDGDLDLMVSNDFNADRLYVNDGTGHFQDVTYAAQVHKPGMGMGVHFSDYDNDGDLDLHAVYMSNEGGRRVIERVDWDAEGGGQKKKELLLQLIEGNRLYENTLRSPGDALTKRNLNEDGLATFVDVTPDKGPFEAEWAWAGGFIDFNNDGREDLYCSNGFFSGESMHDAAATVWRVGVPVAHDDAVGSDITFGKTMASVAAPMMMGDASWSGHERDKLYMQVDGHKFEDISGISGLDDPGDGRVTLLADFDNDGDMDVFLNNGQHKTNRLFRNEVGQDKGFVRVVLEGTKSGKDGFGAQVRVKTARGVLTHAKSGGESFISQYDPRPLFGLDGAAEAEWIEVTWLTGEKVRTGPVASGTTLKFVEGQATPTTVELPRGDLARPRAASGLSAR